MNEEKKEAGFLKSLTSFEHLITPKYIKVLFYATSILSIIGLIFVNILAIPATESIGIVNILIIIIGSLLSIISMKIMCENILIKFKQHDELVKIRKLLEER